MIIRINKDHFKNFSNGTHTLRVNYVNGYAEGTFEVRDSITFYLNDVAFTATTGMTWGEWILSFGQSATENGIVAVAGVSQDAKIHLNPTYHAWQSTKYPNSKYSDTFSAEFELFNGDVLQLPNSVIVHNARYGQADNAPT